ncbi:GNAT family N-acetyltransferase [Vibrio sp. S9_S30]|uniref:GNAT family N-acetyltransferase n=1 Tax=Vibrio sp. S9_S30 TaxID=2720226 RepID=UPI001681C098|nr:GNAT family N-acetyltransferase [Vibrio sp. S9_S30]MBD1556392.1 GNAT family N-acetyltransferase [Vibrio sp. S9_S30]
MDLMKATTEHVAIAADLFNQYRVFYGHESDIGVATTFIQERLENNESVVFLALNEQGEGIGFTQLYPTFSSVSAQRSWILNDLFVTENARGKGVGKALMNVAKELAVSTNAKGLALETARDNLTAQTLYESLGYERDTTYYSYFLRV